jgi:hypothetical protein
MTTASEDLRELLVDLKIPIVKAETIKKWFEQVMRDRDEIETLWVAGSRPAVETVEVYGLEIGVDACGNAEHVTAVMPGVPRGFLLDEIEYEG